MKKNLSQNHYIDGIMILILFLVFAGCILLVLTSGAGVYKRINARDDATYSTRVATQYISTLVHQAETPDSVAVSSVGDSEALCVTERLNGKAYVKYLYVYDGSLRELYVAKGSSVQPEFGEELMEMESLSFSLKQGLLTVQLQFPEQEAQSFCLNIRGEETP